MDSRVRKEKKEPRWKTHRTADAVRGHRHVGALQFDAVRHHERAGEAVKTPGNKDDACSVGVEEKKGRGWERPPRERPWGPRREEGIPPSSLTACAMAAVKAAVLSVALSPLADGCGRGRVRM